MLKVRMMHLGKAEIAIHKLKFNLLELNRSGWGLVEDAPACETTEKWLSAIDVSNRSVIWSRLMHLHEVWL